MLITGFLLSLLFHQILANNLCPTEELTEECKCNGSTSIIICKGDFNEERWDQILDEIRDQFHDKILKGFHLSSKKLTILNKNAFKNLKFKKLFIFSPKLTFIHRDAFDGLEDQLEEINVYRSNLTNVQPESEFNLFQAFTKLIQLQQLTISDSNLVKIPKEAFKPDDLTKIQNNLTAIYFINLESKNVKLKTIGSKAFYYLPSLKLIDFTGQKIDKIKKDAFKFKNKSGVQLMIDLSGNLLHGESFENDSLTGIQRPTRIYFGLPACNVNFTYLKYHVFHPFLNEHQQNKIDLGKSCDNVICDCKMNWIVKFHLESRVKNLRCKNNMIGLKGDAKCQNQNQIQESLTQKQPEESFKNPMETTCFSKSCLRSSDKMLMSLNKSVNPCDDFYNFACGKWENTHTIQMLLHTQENGGSEYDNFVKMRIKVMDNLNNVLSGKINGSDPLVVQKLMSMYSNCKSNSLFNKSKMLKIIDQLTGGWPMLNEQFDEKNYNWTKAFIKIFSYLRQDFIFSLEPIVNTNSVMQLKINHGSFILSAYKLSEIISPKRVKDIASYVGYISNVALSLGPDNDNNNDDIIVDDDDKANSKTRNQTLEMAFEIVKFESDLAKISTLLDSKEVTIERKLSSLKCLIPEVDWVNIIKQIAINHDADFDLIHDSNVILDVNYLIKISQLIKKTKPRVLANYFGWRTAETIGFLAGGQDFLLIQNEFHERQWNAQSKLLWKQCLKPLQYHGAMGIGRKYLQRYLPKQHRDQVIQIADSVQKSFAHSVENNDWLPENKKEFVKRIKNIHFNIGYPEWILEQEKLDNFYKKFMEVGAKDYVDDYMSLWKFKIWRFMNGIGKKYDKLTIWDTPLFHVGANYDTIGNIITVPLGILHPPFYDIENQPYLNFGSIGSFIGHELSHSIMPRYDEEDNLVFPWNKTVLKPFLTRAKCFVDQYSSFEEFDMKLDGLKTFEEDISDVEGVKSSFSSYKQFIDQSSKNTLSIPGLENFNDKQMFFISYAQNWCQFSTPIQVKYKILKGVHSPEKYRVNGALANFDEFAPTFQCSIGTKMNPKSKCHFW